MLGCALNGLLTCVHDVGVCSLKTRALEFTGGTMARSLRIPGLQQQVGHSSMLPPLLPTTISSPTPPFLPFWQGTTGAGNPVTQGALSKPTITAPHPFACPSSSASGSASPANSFVQYLVQRQGYEHAQAEAMVTSLGQQLGDLRNRQQQAARDGAPVAAALAVPSRSSPAAAVPVAAAASVGRHTSLLHEEAEFSRVGPVLRERIHGVSECIGESCWTYLSVVSLLPLFPLYAFFPSESPLKLPLPPSRSSFYTAISPGK